MKVLIAIAASALLVGGCGQKAEDRAGQAETDVAASTAAAAVARPLGKAVSGAQAKKVMHDRHEGMEEIGEGLGLRGGA